MNLSLLLLLAILPAGRETVWNPGVPGGIPNRTTVCATIAASVCGNGSNDCRATIQAAIDACPANQVVQLGAGDFKVLQNIHVWSNVTLRGAGPTATRLKVPVGTNANVVTVGQQWFPFGFFGTSRNLSANAAKGATAVTLSSAAGIVAGGFVLIDQITDPNTDHWSSLSPPGDPSRGWFSRYDRPRGQIVVVTAVNGTTISVDPALHTPFATARTAQMTPINNYVVYAGLEDLSAEGGSAGQGNIWVRAAYSWVKNVNSYNQDGVSITLDGAFRCTVRDSYVHETQSPYPGGGGYGIGFSYYSSDNLIENNIIWRMNKVMVMRTTGGGNVIGYNYMEDGYIGYDLGWVESGCNASHMIGAHYELFEGNQCFNFDGDDRWGGSTYVAVFRNHFTARRRDISNLGLVEGGNNVGAQIGVGHWWYTFVGNVLGTPGMSPAPQSSFTYQDFEPWANNPFPMWRFGRGEGWGATDPKVGSTAVRDGNYDYVSASVNWDNAIQTIPNSLYLASKPAFFGSYTWPWVDPVGSTRLYTLPARARFDAGTPFAGPPGETPPVPVAPGQPTLTYTLIGS